MDLFEKKHGLFCLKKEPDVDTEKNVETIFFDFAQKELFENKLKFIEKEHFDKTFYSRKKMPTVGLGLLPLAVVRLQDGDLHAVGWCEGP